MKTLPYDLITFLLNYIITYIPFWHIRKIFYKICGMKIGSNSIILMGTKIYKPWKIRIGNNVVINEKCILDGRGGIIIGNNVSISMYTYILTGTHDVHSNCFEYKSDLVILKDNVWTGIRSIILPGAVFEKKAVLAAGSVAKGGGYDEDYIYSGVPALKIKRREVSEDYLLGTWKPWFR